MQLEVFIGNHPMRKSPEVMAHRLTVYLFLGPWRTLSGEESLSPGKNIEESGIEIVRGAHGTFLMIIQGTLLLNGGVHLFYIAVIQMEEIFGKTILLCGLHLIPQKTYLVSLIFLVELVKDLEKALLTLIGFAVMVHPKEGGTLWETLKVTGCAIQDL